MATLGQDPKRLGIFFFFDAQGIVDSYVETLLTDMVKNLSELVIVVNGELTAKSYAKLTAFTDNIILRENKGMDAWAYKTALESYGWDRLVEFDEVIFVLDAGMKKSPRGGQIPQEQVERLEARLAKAREAYLQNKNLFIRRFSERRTNRGEDAATVTPIPGR